MEQEIINNQSDSNVGNKKLGVASLVLGIVAVVLAILMPKLCLICGILSIIFSVVSKKASLSTAGMVLGIIGTVISFLFVTIEMDIDNGSNNAEIVSEDARSKVIGTWYGASDLSSLEKGDYTIIFKLDEDYNFTWGEYGDSENNRVEGKYTFEDLHKTNYGKNTTYYKVEIKGDKFYMNGALQNQEYGNTYEFGVINTNGVEDSGVLASTITSSLYFLKKVE